MLNHLIPAQDIHKIIRGGEAWLSWVSSVKVKSDVTYSQVWWPILRIRSLHLSHPKCTHTQQWTHTHTHSSEHTPGAVGSQSCCITRGAVGGLVPFSRAPQSWYWRWRERCTFTPPTDNPCRTWDSNLQPFNYESNSLTIRPQLVCWHMFKRHHFTDLMYWYTCSYLQPTVTSCVFNSWLALYVLLENQISEA